jgi:hypothetical protein
MILNAALQSLYIISFVFKETLNRKAIKLINVRYELMQLDFIFMCSQKNSKI